MARRRHTSIFMGYIASRRILLLDFLPRHLQSGSRTKIINALNAVPPMANKVVAGLVGLWTPKLTNSVHSNVSTLFFRIQFRIRSWLTNLPIYGILSALKKVSHATSHKTAPANKLDCDVGVRVIGAVSPLAVGQTIACGHQKSSSGSQAQMRWFLPGSARLSLLQRQAGGPTSTHSASAAPFCYRGMSWTWPPWSRQSDIRGRGFWNRFGPSANRATFRTRRWAERLARS